MRVVPLTTSILLCAVAAFAGEIREFNIPTLEKLGREISHRDAIAARATDVMLETQPVARSLKMRGWITDLRKNGDMVYFIVETSSGPSVAYTVTFHGLENPQVEDHRGDPLPPNIALRYKARNTAMKALKGKLDNINYNFEVLDDPNGGGFLVYALAVTPKSDQVVMAGHFRVTVSADGTKERVDALSKSLLFSGPMKSSSPKGGDAVALFLIQIVSNKPVETLIYTSNLAKKPIYVRTPDGKTWVVGDDKMRVERSKPSN